MNQATSVNPFGYFCPSNGCTPEYVPCQDFNDFLGYGLLVCWIDGADTVCRIRPHDVCDLREAFLNCVEDAMRFWQEQEIGKDTGCDPAQPIVSLACPQEECCEAGWRFERVDEDALLFVFFWTGADDRAIWLAREVIEGKEQRPWPPSLRPGR